MKIIEINGEKYQSAEAHRGCVGCAFLDTVCWNNEALVVAEQAAGIDCVDNKLIYKAVTPCST